MSYLVGYEQVSQKVQLDMSSVEKELEELKPFLKDFQGHREGIKEAYEDFLKKGLEASDFIEDLLQKGSKKVTAKQLLKARDLIDEAQTKAKALEQFCRWVGPSENYLAMHLVGAAYIKEREE